MPIETDIGNLRKRIEDATEDLPGKILEVRSELENLEEIISNKEILLGRIDELSADIEEFLTETQNIE